MSIFHCITELNRRSASSLVSADVSEGAGRPPGARGRHVELAHRRAGLVHAGEGQGQRACKMSSIFVILFNVIGMSSSTCLIPEV